MRKKRALFLFAAVFSAFLLCCCETSAKSSDKDGDLLQKIEALEKKIDRLERELALRPLDVSAYSLPEEVSFCGEKVNLKDPMIRERIEREFLVILGDRAQVILWMKRSGRVFPAFERELKAQSVCSDLKYLAVVESGLRSSVTSRASAHGFWQFMAPTARDLGLTVDDALDERADLQASTRAGIAYLKQLYERFGSWPLAMAAYNTGPNRLKSAQDQQGLKDYWRLMLIQEAERYVPRIIAVKIVLEHLDDYGFHFEEEQDVWPDVPQTVVKQKMPANKKVLLLDLARLSGVDYRVLRHLNPQFTSDALPQDREVKISVPIGTDALVTRALQSAIAAAPEIKPPKSENKGKSAGKPTAAAARQPASQTQKTGSSSKQQASKTGKTPTAPKQPAYKTYKVKKGDSLSAIAERHHMTVSELRKLNGLSSRSQLQAGQVLKVKAR